MFYSNVNELLYYTKECNPNYSNDTYKFEFTPWFSTTIDYFILDSHTFSFELSHLSTIKNSPFTSLR